MDPSHTETLTARALPAAGTLTFLFTDVEGSTPLWDQHEALMREVTARHDALLDAVIAANAGIRVRERGEGDSLFAVFERPVDAVAAALAIGKAVLAEPWPAETLIRVRIGLHTGSAQLRAGDYYGPVVNRCARIRGLGHGGQVLLSSATTALVSDALPPGASLRSLGAHSLKGLSNPEEVFQLGHPDLPAAFPPLLSPQAPRHNLPRALSELIGREAEQGEILALLAEAPLVTLTGSGGVGKTRLSLAVAAEVVDQYPDGVWLVELASLADPTLVHGAVAQVLGVREEPGRPLAATLIDHLHDRQMLLVLDNCEHLVAACADLAGALLRSCPHLRILATSREGLEIAGERRWRVPSLTVPDPQHLPPPELTGSYEAVRLFVARARERRADFALSAQNARAIAQICARLDGIPLAVELAAARVESLGVEGLAARLDDRFRLLTGGARDALPRQRTLRAALDWSYDLLAEQEQLLLDRLAVFAGGWTLAAAEAVCAGRLGGSTPVPARDQGRLGESTPVPLVRVAQDGAHSATSRDQGEGVEDWEVLDLLDRLVNKSLVQTEEAAGEVRYWLLETVRQYGQERLASRGSERVQDRHLAWCLALAEEAAPHLTGPEQAAWLRRLAVEHDNLRAGLRQAVAWGRANAGLRVAGAMWRFWTAHGHLSEGRRWLALVLAMSAESQDPDEAGARFVALHAATMLALEQSDLPHASELAGQSVVQARTGADPRHLARAFDAQGQVARLHGDHAQATALHQEALALARQTTDRLLTAEVLFAIGEDYGFAGEHGRSEPFYAESLALFRAVGDRRRVADNLERHALQATLRGAHAQAEAMARESVALFRELGDTGKLAEALFVLGGAAAWQGAHAQARAWLEESLVLRRERGDGRGAAWSLGMLAIAALLEGDINRMVTLAEESLALAQESGDRGTQANALACLGNAAILGGQRERGVGLLAESLLLFKSTGTHLCLSWAIEGMARVVAAQEDMEAAVLLYSAMTTVGHTTSFSWILDRDAYEETMTIAQQRLGDEAFAAAHAAGQAVTLDEAIALALAAAAAR